jgi:hypothetical protein
VTLLTSRLTDDSSVVLLLTTASWSLNVSTRTVGFVSSLLECRLSIIQSEWMVTCSTSWPDFLTRSDLLVGQYSRKDGS